MSVQIRFKKLNANAIIPRYETVGSAGADLKAIGNSYIKPGETIVVPLGFSVAIPSGYEIQIRPRSGLAAKHGITILNSPGTIDSDFRGELGVIMSNFGAEAFYVEPGDRIAQMVLSEVPQANFVIVEELDDTERGSGGFGSTGVN